MGELPHEVIYQVEFPERPGALKKFLSVLQPQWNITLFHYRRSGGHAILWYLLICTQTLSLLWLLNDVESGLLCFFAYLCNWLTTRIAHLSMCACMFPLSCCRGVNDAEAVLGHAAGNRTSQALLGLQLPPNQQRGFAQVIQELEADFTFTTLPEDARRVFDMFIQ